MLKYLHNDNGLFVYPISDILSYLRDKFPATSFPVTITEAIRSYYGIYEFIETPKPGYDVLTQKVQEGTPAYDAVSNQYTQVWDTVACTAEETAAVKQGLISSIMAEIENVLDSFARTKGYNSIHSAASYKGSSVASFNTEGTYCFDMRDQYWSIASSILADVDAGNRSMPYDYAEIASEFPALTWP